MITLLIIFTDEGVSLPAVAFWCENYGVKASNCNLTEYWSSTQHINVVKLHYNRQPTNNEANSNSELLLNIALVDCIVSHKDACCSMILLLGGMLVRLGWCECFGANVLGICSSNMELMQCLCGGILIVTLFFDQPGIKNNLGSRS